MPPILPVLARRNATRILAPFRLQGALRAAAGSAQLVLADAPCRERSVRDCQLTEAPLIRVLRIALPSRLAKSMWQVEG